MASRAGTATSGVPAKTTRIRGSRPRVACGETLTGGCSSPNHSDSRISLIAALRASASSRSMNSTPSRWSVSCWIARASRSEPSMVTGSPCMSKPWATTESARRQSKVSSGIDRQPSGPSWISVGEVEPRVDQVADLAVDVPGEDPQPDADLRRGEAGAGRVEHGVGEVLDEPAQLLVEVDDLDRGLAQDRVAEQADGLDGHGASV